jgi:hypothetical protein
VEQSKEKPSRSPSVAEVKVEIDEVLHSHLFKQAPKMRRLLEYMCQKSLLLEGHKVTEYTIAVDVLGKPTSFKESRDSSVRVEVYRLRKRLAQFYEGDGRHRPIRIVLPQGRYCPEFVHPESVMASEPAVASPPAADIPEFDPEPIFEPQVVEPVTVLQLSPDAETPVRSRRFNSRLIAVAGIFIMASLVTLSIVTLTNKKNLNLAVADRPAAGALSTAVPAPLSRALPAAGAVRILAGYSGPAYPDMAGNAWGPDRFFSGGRPSHIDIPHIGRTYDQRRYENSRIGDSAYDIPLPPGNYELHLYFMEHEYAPEVGRGENDRTFFLHLNDRRIEPAIDIESEAMGPFIADERVFKAIQPGANGKLHIALESGTGVPLINAIEVLPGSPHAQLPIRLIPQRALVTDHLGRVWQPDRYSFNGQTCPRNQPVSNTADPQLFSVERYGHFDYSIPVDVNGQYTVNCYFAERYFGTADSGGGPGSRIFNVMGNGVMLFPKLDIFAQVGSGRALIKSAHHLKPTAQGKLNLTFEPVVNYALINAIEVIDEAQQPVQ